MEEQKLPGEDRINVHKNARLTPTYPLTAQLIDATTGLRLWAEGYDRNLEDIFAIQDQIMREIVVALDVELPEGERSRLWARGISRVR